jgi:hypothetical protein
MDDDNTWRQVASTLENALPEIDDALAEANMPLNKRKTEALDIIRQHMIQTDDWQTFFVSEPYARIMAIVDERYRARYGSAFEMETDRFESLLVVHRFPFMMHVPLTFSIPGEEKGTAWVGFPASVQKEENPFKWIAQGPNIEALSASERDELLAQATRTANSTGALGTATTRWCRSPC